MFFSLQKKERQEEYEELLKIVGCLSNLFSDSDAPFLHYRVVEKVFCQAFKADDLSRSDISVDAKIGSLGIGLKTFLAGNNKTFQKVAEFNSARPLYDGLSDDSLVRKISELRNDRIDFTEKLYGLDKSMYHCVLRDDNRFRIFEEPMHRVNVSDIRNIKKNRGSIAFNDGINEYSFSLSKSTLNKRFVADEIKQEFNVPILKDPIKELKVLLDGNSLFSNKPHAQVIYLPLYGRNQTVFLSSGLNFWNASIAKRARHFDEVYIPIPVVIHKKFPNFFPDRDVSFDLIFPDGEMVKSSVCQAGGKALMTKKNKKLGKLILRDGLKLKEGEVVTFDKLQALGIDSVRIDKVSDSEYEINFSKNGSYELFMNSWC